MKPVFYLIFIALLCFECSGNGSQTENSAAESGDWQLLFNGEDLSGLTTMGDLQTGIKDGALHILATHPYNNAWVMTERDYANFNLECEFRMPDTTANSGVLIRFDPAKEGNPNQTAYEANIDWHTDIQTPMGTLEYAARAKVLENLNPEDWHKMRITAKGDHLAVWIDGQMVCETHDRRASTGRIAFQVPIYQDDEIAFRNIRAQELPDTPSLEPTLEDQYRNSDRPMQPMFEGPSTAGWHTLGSGTWSFEGDVLHGHSGEAASYLVTDRTYKNFYLKCGFRIAKEDNSGIFIRKHPDSTSVGLPNAIECNIYDHNGPAHAYSTGSIVSHARAWANMIDYDNWNEMEIFARDEQIVLYVNGKKSAEAHVPAAYDRPGNICLQAGTRLMLDNGPSDIYFRELTIRDMAD